MLDFYPETIIDAGANIGLAAVYFANKYPKSTIVSIEPETTNFNVLQKNVQHYPSVHPLNKALSNKKEVLRVEDVGLGHWGFMTSSIPESETNVVNSIESTTLSEIMTQFKFDHLDIVKIDIEGYEKELFESDYEDWVPKTRCLIIELHDRMKMGCSTSFFSCISKYNFSFSMQGENLIFINNDLTVNDPQPAINLP
jgi:FkbM family methyltransferase